MTLHPAARGFDRAVEAYERSRPGYPDEAVDWLARVAGIGPRSDVLDLAAGTGKFTRALARTRARVKAVEPLEAMLAELRCPDVDTRVGSAEEIPLTEGSVDLVTVAQAFHWFDHGRAMPEIHRVLRPGGHLALVSNDRQLDAAVHARVEELIGPYRGDTPRHRDMDWRALATRGGLFEPVAEHRVPNDQWRSVEGVVERIASTSFIAALPGAERAQLLDEVRAFAATLPQPIHVPYMTTVAVYARV